MKIDIFELLNGHADGPVLNELRRLFDKRDLIDVLEYRQLCDKYDEKALV